MASRLASRSMFVLGRRYSSNIDVGQANKKQCYQSTRNNSSYAGRNFLTLKDYSGSEIKELLQLSLDIKTRIKNGEILSPLARKTLAMIFQKRSTRTRVSTESGMAVLGGHAIFLSPQDVHFGVNETVHDSAKVLSRLTDGIFARVFGHDILEEMASVATVPIINGLSEMFHPLQGLADFMTLKEHYGSIEGKTLAWIGDGNNIIHTLMMAGPKLGVNLKISTPKGYEPNSDVAYAAKQFAAENNTTIEFTHSPREACIKSNIIVTDTWTSMGQEDEAAERLKSFEGYKVTSKLTALADDDWCFLHCLPRHPEEVDDEVFYSNRSLIWQEAENRKWTVMAVLLSHMVGQDKI